MKKYFMMAAAMLLAATSCTNESVNDVVENNAEQGYAPVTVHVNDFSITQEEMPSGGGTTRAAQNPADYTDVGAITLAFYDAVGTEVYKTTQIKGDGTYTTFGEFTANLQVGTYTLVAVARYYYAGDAFTLTSPIVAAYTSERPRETFCLTQAVTVTSASALDLDVTLNRISSWLKIVSTDGRPASATKVRTTFAKGGKGFNPTTGLATTDTGFSQTNNPSTAVGATIEVNALPFLFTDEESMNITIEVLDASDNVLLTKVVNDVPFKRNRKTILRGAIFTVDASSAAFKLETSWLDDETVNF
jgi:hypothetical protein